MYVFSAQIQMVVSDLSFENVEGYQQECLLLSKSHFFNKQVIQQQSHQRKELAKVIEVQEIHFWETPSASFHEVNAAFGELEVACSVTAKLLCLGLCSSGPTFHPRAPQQSPGQRTGLSQTPRTSRCVKPCVPSAPHNLINDMI